MKFEKVNMLHTFSGDINVYSDGITCFEIRKLVFDEPNVEFKNDEEIIAFVNKCDAEYAKIMCRNCENRICDRYEFCSQGVKPQYYGGNR